MEGAFGRYRIMSFVTGTTLLILCGTLLLHIVDLKLWKSMYIFVAVVGIGHGVVLYPIYLIMSFQVALKARLHLGYVALMLGAGFVPGLAFYMENRMEHKLFPDGYLASRRASRARE
jgi:integral membrane protein